MSDDILSSIPDAEEAALSFIEVLRLPVDGILRAAPKGFALVYVGGLEDQPFMVDADTLQKFGAFRSNSSFDRTNFYVSDEASNFKLALRLARENTVDPTVKRSKSALHKHIRIATIYGLPIELTQQLVDRYAVLQNLVMPEIAALLETNPRRKLLLLRSVVRKARLMDIISGGTQSVQSKVARIKVATNLIDVCESPASTMSEVWKRKFLRNAGNILTEGRSVETLPNSVNAQIEALQKRIQNLKSNHASTDESTHKVSQPPKLVRAISESRRTYIEKKTLKKRVTIRPLLPVVPERLPDDICVINCSGIKIFKVHQNELRRFGVLDSADPQVHIYVGDDPSRFSLALHLVRCEGKLEDGEKADDSILKSYRQVAYSYGLDWSIVRRIESWINAHKNGVGGARNAREEIRALSLTRIVNPEKGDALVASAMAEAYMERVMNEKMPDSKKQRLLQKAEINLRTVLPVLLTSMSVMQVSAEQKTAIDQSITVLKQVLSMQGRAGEAKDLDAQVKLFSQGIQGAAKELSALTRSVPAGMYA